MLAASFLPAVLPAQHFKAKLASTEVGKGMTFEVAFSLDSDEGMRFTPPRFGGLKVVSGPFENTSTTFVNGKVSAEKAWVYELRAEQTGQFTIGAAMVISGGRTLSTQPVTVRVVEPKTLRQVPSGADAKCFVSGELESTNAFVGQQLTWCIKVYTQTDVDGLDIIDLPNFDGFYAKEKRRFDTRVQQVNIKGRQYSVKTLHEEALFPQSTGSLTIGAAQVRLMLPEAGPFGMSIPRPVVMQTMPVTINVLETPAGAPEGFAGAVGQYTWEVTADSLNVSTDGAVTVKITIKGNGDGKRFASPTLRLGAGLETFDPRVVEEEEYETVDELMHRRALEYVILPQVPGVYPFEPTFSYYDPDSNAYKTLRVPRLDSLRVVAGKNYKPSAAGRDSADAQIVYPHASDGSSHGFWGNLWIWILAALSFFGALLFWFLRRNRAKWQFSTQHSGLPKDVAANRQRPTAPETKHVKKDVTASTPPHVAAAVQPRSNTATHAKHLENARQALAAAQPKLFYSEIQKALEAALVQGLGLSKSEIQLENILQSLSARHAPAPLTQNVLSLWQTCEQALFAGQVHAAQMEPTLRLAVTTTAELARM